MLELTMPALWSTVHGWFTPAVLFLLLNLVIGTIVFTSKATAASRSGEAGRGAAADGEKRRLSLVPSMALERLRTFNLPSRLAAPAPEPTVTSGLLDLGSDDHPPPLEEEEDHTELEHEHEHAHMERSMSEAAVEAQLPRLPKRMRKSASEKSAFAHFVAEEDTEVVEARRPATTRDAAHGWLLVSDTEESDDELEDAATASEVDARADDFINKFRQQLNLQRIDSLMHYKDNLRRVQAAAAAGTN